MQRTSFSRHSSSLEQTTGSVRDTFDQYLDNIGAIDLLTPEEELHHGRAVRAARERVWETLLCAPFEHLITEALEQACRDGEGDAMVRDALVILAQPRAKGESEQGRRALAERLAKLDQDATLADQVWRALDRLCQVASVSEEAAGDASELLGFRDAVARSRDALHRARNRFACANLRLVVKVAQRYGRTRMSLADRVQEGNLGLMKAVDRFDPDKGYRFSTYAAWWIRHAITRSLINRGRTVRVPAHIHTLFVKMMRVEKELAFELGRDPSEAELAARLEVPVERVETARDAMQLRAVPFDASPSGAEDARSLEELLEDPATVDVAWHMDERRTSAIVLDAVRDLEPIERQVIEKRFGLDGTQKMTLQKLGEQFSLSRERIRQLQNRALLKLRDRVEQSTVPTTAFA